MTRMHWYLGLAAIVLVPGVGLAADKKKGKVSPEIAKQIREAFDKMDLDKDGSLDRAELAKAFRGPGAKPLPEPKKDEKKTEPTDPTKKPAPSAQSKFPDGAFLEKFDADDDGKVSFGEYDDGLSEIIAEQLDAQKKLNDAEKKLAQQQKELGRREYEVARRQFDQMRRQHEEMLRRQREFMRRMNR